MVYLPVLRISNYRLGANRKRKRGYWCLWNDGQAVDVMTLIPSVYSLPYHKNGRHLFSRAGFRLAPGVYLSSRGPTCEMSPTMPRRAHFLQPSGAGWGSVPMAGAWWPSRATWRPLAGVRPSFGRVGCVGRKWRRAVEMAILWGPGPLYVGGHGALIEFKVWKVWPYLL